LVGYRGNLFIIEIKNPEYLLKKYQGKSEETRKEGMEAMLSDGERSCMEMFKKVGVPYHLASTLDEAIKIINQGKVLKF